LALPFGFNNQLINLKLLTPVLPQPSIGKNTIIQATDDYSMKVVLFLVAKNCCRWNVMMLIEQAIPKLSSLVIFCTAILNKL
jgi:hypothetical protein